MTIKNDAERGKVAAAAFLERVGITVLETEYSTPHGWIPIITEDDGRLVYVAVSLDKRAHPASRASLKRYRLQMQDYLEMSGSEATRDIENVRYDSIQITVIADDRALLRHFRNIEAGGDHE